MEWSQLNDPGAWDSSAVELRKLVIEWAAKEGVSVHLGSTMELCYVKNSELQLDDPNYKRRMAFRAGQNKDESRYHTLFGDHGISASHRTVAKALDAIGRMLGCKRTDSDVTLEYHQGLPADAHLLLVVSPQTFPLRDRSIGDQSHGTV